MFSMKDIQINCHTGCLQIKGNQTAPTPYFLETLLEGKSHRIFIGDQKANWASHSSNSGQVSSLGITWLEKEDKETGLLQDNWYPRVVEHAAPEKPTLVMLFCFSMKTPHCLLTEPLGVSVAKSSIWSLIMLCWTGECKGWEKEQARTVLHTGEQTQPFRDWSQELTGGGCGEPGLAKHLEFVILNH